MPPRQPKSARGFVQPVVEGAFNPRTSTHDLSVTVDSSRLEHLYRWSLAAYEEAKRHLKPTLLEPDHVFEAADDEYVYCKRVTADAEKLYYVRVRPTGWRAYLWDFEAADPQHPDLPLSRATDRFRRQVL